jgi:hypothetical protein
MSAGDGAKRSTPSFMTSSFVNCTATSNWSPVMSLSGSVKLFLGTVRKFIGHACVCLFWALSAVMGFVVMGADCTFVGDRLVLELGVLLGEPLGDEDGTALCEPLGEELGPALGDELGQALGEALGAALGEEIGPVPGEAAGPELGAPLGEELGPPLGAALEPALGRALGRALGPALGPVENDPIRKKLVMLFARPSATPSSFLYPGPSSAPSAAPSMVPSTGPSGLPTFAPSGAPSPSLSIYCANYMVATSTGSLGYLMVSRSVVSKDTDDFEYTPQPKYPGAFEIFNEVNEKALLEFFIEYQYRGRCSVHLDAFHWIQRDSFFPQGSQGLKAVTKHKLGYDSVELDPEDMVRFAQERPVHMATYSVSDAMATYYLYEKYVHSFIFSHCSIIPMGLEDVLRKGSGTFCEMLLMVQACQKNIISRANWTPPWSWTRTVSGASSRKAFQMYTLSRRPTAQSSNGSPRVSCSMLTCTTSSRTTSIRL